MKAVISGGGTGGHIYPALSIAQQLRADGVDILYMGGRGSLEAKLASANGFAFFGVECAGLHRRSLRIIKDLLTNGRGLQQAKAQLRQFRPDVVVGTGGYAEAPVLKAAQSLGIPTVLHEQNAFPGLANRAMARQAKAVCLTFQAAAPYFPHQERLHLTGLPIREQILAAKRDDARKYFHIPDDGKPTLLITGGSQGAAKLNDAAAEAMESLLAEGYRVIHICGKKEYEQRKAAMPQHPCLILRPYVEEMENALVLADLAVSRAGASFIAEAVAVGLPTILVPYPYAANDHQRYNARALEKQGAAILVENDSLSGERLLQEVRSLLGDDARRGKMSAQCRAMAVPDAAARIAEIIYKITK